MLTCVFLLVVLSIVYLTESQLLAEGNENELGIPNDLSLSSIGTYDNTMSLDDVPEQYLFLNNQCWLTEDDWAYLVCFFDYVVDSPRDILIGTFAYYDESGGYFYISEGSDGSCGYDRAAYLYLIGSDVNSSFVVQNYACNYNIYFYNTVFLTNEPNNTSYNISDDDSMISDDDTMSLDDVPEQYLFLNNQCWLTEDVWEFQVCFYDNVVDSPRDILIGTFAYYDESGGYFYISQGNDSSCGYDRTAYLYLIGSDVNSSYVVQNYACNFNIYFYNTAFLTSDLNNSSSDDSSFWSIGDCGVSNYVDSCSLNCQGTLVDLTSLVINTDDDGYVNRVFTVAKSGYMYQFIIPICGDTPPSSTFYSSNGSPSWYTSDLWQFGTSGTWYLGSFSSYEWTSTYYSGSTALLNYADTGQYCSVIGRNRITYLYLVCNYDYTASSPLITITEVSICTYTVVLECDEVCIIPEPTEAPVIAPSVEPSSFRPSRKPNVYPTVLPSVGPTISPSNVPVPTVPPTPHPSSSNPTIRPSKVVSVRPSCNPSFTPSLSTITYIAFDTSVTLIDLTVSTLNSLDELAVAYTVATVLDLDLTQVTYVSQSVVTNSNDDTRRRLSDEVLVTVNVLASSQVYSASTLYTTLTNTLTEAVANGAFTDTLHTISYQIGATNMESVNISSVVVGSYSTVSSTVVNDDDSSSNGSLSVGAIVGIVVGGGVACVLLFSALWFYLKRSSKVNVSQTYVTVKVVEAQSSAGASIGASSNDNSAYSSAVLATTVGANEYVMQSAPFIQRDVEMQTL